MAARIYLSKTISRALTPTGGFLRGFGFTLNPYIGCAFGAARGCPFCYVRALAVARAKEGAWGDWVIAKENLAERLEWELEALRAAGRLEQTAIFMSSATDPYQGIERRMKLSRAALELFVRFAVRRVVLQTRSPLVERDIDLMLQLRERLIVSITVETDDDTVRRAITPTSPSIQRRIRTATALRKSGIMVQLAIAPMMPNHPERFAEIAQSAADRVIVDTYFDGDGAGGSRSRALGMGELYAKLGYEGWFRPGAERELLAAMRSRLGNDRVLFSREGFNAV
ncbi:MAG TPA: radical SAM protein [Candidatus Binataceae bacterium]